MSDESLDNVSMDDIRSLMDQAAANPEKFVAPKQEIQEEATPQVEAVQPSEEVKPVEDPVSNEPKIEYVSFTDPVDGKKKRIKVDLSNAEAIKATYAKAAGLIPKYQRERDTYKAELDKSKDAIEAYSKLNSVFQEQGIKGVLTLLGGGEDAIQAFIEEEQAKQEWRRDASPEELEAVELRKKFEKAEKEREELLAKIEQEKEEAIKAKQTAAEKEMQSKLAASFEKWRFTPDQSDAKTAAKLNKVVWREALETLAEQGNENPTRRDIEKAFKEARSFVSGHINKEVQAKTQEVYNNRKADAQVRVANQVASNAQMNDAESEARDLVSKGGIRALMNKLWD